MTDPQTIVQLGAEARQLQGNPTLKTILGAIHEDAIERLNRTRTTDTDEVKDAVRVLQLVAGITTTIQSMINDGHVATQQLDAMYVEPKVRALNRGY